MIDKSGHQLLKKVTFLSFALLPTLNKVTMRYVVTHKSAGALRCYSKK